MDSMLAGCLAASLIAFFDSPGLSNKLD